MRESIASFGRSRPPHKRGVVFLYNLPLYYYAILPGARTMIKEIWEPDMMAVFVSTAVLELSETLGFSHLHPKDRLWELLELGGITPTRVITSQERKALADGHHTIIEYNEEEMVKLLIYYPYTITFCNVKEMANFSTPYTNNPIQQYFLIVHHPTIFHYIFFCKQLRIVYLLIM